jgi:dTDP-4-dehydrorhamnose reductase
MGFVRRVWVTGASGFVGRHVVAAFGSGVDVMTDRVDVRRRDDVHDFVNAKRPDVIVHCAFLQDGPDAWAVTADGTAHVASAAHAVAARMVHLSSDVVFDGLLGRPYREDDPVSPVTDYARAKAAAEVAAFDAGNEVLIVRTSLVLSGDVSAPSRHERVELTGPGAMAFFVDEVRCPILVRDLACAVVQLAGLDVTGVLHVAGPDPVSRADLARSLARRRGIDPSRVGTARSADQATSRPLDVRLDSSAAIALLGWTPSAIT